MCLCGLRFKKHIILHILYIIVAPLCSAFLKRIDFYKAHSSEKRGVLWLASYPVRCDWPNTSSVWRKCYAPYHICKHTASPWQQYYSKNKRFSLEWILSLDFNSRWRSTQMLMRIVRSAESVISPRLRMLLWRKINVNTAHCEHSCNSLQPSLILWMIILGSSV